MIQQQNRMLISNSQYFLMVIAAITSFGHFIYIHLVLTYAGRDAWLSLVFAMIISTAIVWLHTKLDQWKQQDTLTEFAVTMMGSWIGTALSIFYFIYFLLISTITVRILMDFLNLIYPATPQEVWLFLIFSVLAWVSFSGIEVLARVVQFWVPPLIILGISAGILGLHGKDPSEILPIFNQGFIPVWQGTIIFVTMAAETVVFTMIAPHVAHRDKLTKQSLWFMFLMFMLFIGPTTGPVMLFGEYLAKRLTYPTYAELQYIQIHNIMPRMDIVGLVLWTIGAYLRVSIYSYASITTLTRLIKEKNTKIFAIASVTLIMVATSTIAQSRANLLQFLMVTYPVIAIFMGVLVPVVLAVVYSVRQKRQSIR